MFDAQTNHAAPASSGHGKAVTGFARFVGVAVRRIMAAIDTMMARRRTRLQLQSLDDRMLKDIGVSRADVSAESSKPFWRE
jgi:uncharacterized protein YjiS (DUF1127 family)